MAIRRTWLMVALVVVAGVVGVGIFMLFNNDGTNHEITNIPEEQYDVIVIGGEPEGVASAVSAARNGAKTLLVEHREDLGGLFTYGMLNFLDIPQGEDGYSVSKGIFQEWHNLVGGGSAFGIVEAKTAFKKLVDKEENLTFLPETSVEEVILEGDHIQSVKLSNKEGIFEVEGDAFIDATQDGDFAVMAGAPYFIGGEDIGIKDKKMSVTLMIHLKNVDWAGIKKTAESEKFGSAVVNENVAWGFSHLHHVYKPREDNTRLRGLNLAKVGDEYFINALQIFGVDGLDPQSKEAAIEKGKREIENILTYLKMEFPGFENAEIASFPSELYVRETRHIWAEYQLPMSDVWTNRDHWDNIGYGAYPVDIQAQTPQDYGYIVSVPKQYAIPFRSLVPKEIDGLLVVGRAAGFSSIAAGSARVVPTGMTTGEAAGAAAAIASREGMTFREISKNEALIETLRTILAEQGAFVDHISTSYPYEGEWYDGAIQTLINYGLIFGRYDNDMKVDEGTTRESFIRIIKDGIYRVNPDKYNQIEDELELSYQEATQNKDSLLRGKDVIHLLNQIFDEDLSATQQILSNGRLPENLPPDQEIKNKEMYAIAAAILEKIKK